MYINYEIVVQEIREPGIVWARDDYQIRCFGLRHSKPCLGYTLEEHLRPGIFHPERAEGLGVRRGPLFARLQGGETLTLDDGRVVSPADVMGLPRPGRKFSFITDTAYIDDVYQEVAASDLLICEGMFCRDLEESAREKLHLTSSQAALIGKKAEVMRMGLIHYSPRYTKRELQKLLEEAREIFPPAFLTHDGQAIDLPNRDE
jgi:ribonuclease Z